MHQKISYIWRKKLKNLLHSVLGRIGRYAFFLIRKDMNSKISESDIEQLCEEIRNGLGLYDALEICGIPKSTFYDYKRKNPNISDTLKAADVFFKRKHLTNIQNASKDPSKWQASAWLLERKFKDEFSITNKTEMKIVDSLENKTEDELLEELKSLDAKIIKSHVN